MIWDIGFKSSVRHWKILTGARISAGRVAPMAASGTMMIRILLAEDDDAMRVYLKRALEKSGYSVVACDRGTTALEHVRAGEAFDLLLTDIVMPEMDGIELAQTVAKEAPRTRIMFITGF